MTARRTDFATYLHGTGYGDRLTILPLRNATMRLHLLPALTLIALFATPAFGDPPPWSHGRHRDDEGGGYARVVAVVPVYAGSRRRCYEVPVERRANTTGATVLGAVVGGALGSTVGHGSDRNAAIVGGAVIGGVVGHEIAANSTPRPGYRVECRDEGGGPPAYYDVTYRHDGRSFHRRMDHDPGARVRIGDSGGGDRHDGRGDGG